MPQNVLLSACWRLAACSAFSAPDFPVSLSTVGLECSKDLGAVLGSLRAAGFEVFRVGLVLPLSIAAGWEAAEMAAALTALSSACSAQVEGAPA